jgi:endonuclease/exonuclease/phosphatase family metal-dependent hydrolase
MPKKAQPNIVKAAPNRVLGSIVVSALTLAGAVSAKADDVPIRIMTQNVYQGTNFDEVLAATSVPEFLAAVTTTYNNVLATQPAERAAAVANEIAREQPDLVGLQEVASLLTGSTPGAPATTVQFDYLQLLQADLTALGQSYTVVAKLPELDAAAPSSLGFTVRLVRGDAVLARTSDNATVSNVQVDHYVNHSSLPTPVGLVQDLRGLASVDISVGGATFRFATTHLDTAPPIQLQQINELISATSGVTLPLVVVGDFNANADDPNDPTFPTYQAAIDAGFVDAWSAAHGADTGYTCCQAQNLLNATSSLDQRIDLTLLRGDVGVDDVHLIGDSDLDRTTPSGLWPADHAGVIATLEIPQGSVAVPEASTWAMTLLGFVALGFSGWSARNRHSAAQQRRGGPWPQTTPGSHPANFERSGTGGKRTGNPRALASDDGMYSVGCRPSPSSF